MDAILRTPLKRRGLVTLVAAFAVAACDAPSNNRCRLVRAQDKGGLQRRCLPASDPPRQPSPSQSSR